jgi:plasmid stabilization system protein ParE
MTIQWYSEALDDLNQIYDFYATTGSPKAAALLYNQILDDVEILKTHPYIAPTEPILDDCPEQYRSLVVAKGKFKAVYYIAEDSLFIVQIFSCRQDTEKLKRKH